MATYRNPFPTVDIIIRQAGRLVLVERENPPFGWALPGGFVDYGESLEQAALREAGEETGLELTDLRQFRAYSAPDRDPRQHNISFVFTAAGRGTLRGGDDAARAALFPFDELPAPLCFDHDRILADYRSGCALSAAVPGPVRVPAIAFVAPSGTGKTTLLEHVVRVLSARGYRVGVLDHDVHNFGIDRPGKDSDRLTAAGAVTMLIASPEKLSLVKQHTAIPNLDELLATYFPDVDIVFTESFKAGSLPKIEIHRRERSTTLLCRGERHDPALIAVASDQALELDVPVLDLNDPAQVAGFVEQRFLTGG
jgi:molybdopterin-guanine dinucleotide biosynthesis protein MobB